MSTTLYILYYKLPFGTVCCLFTHRVADTVATFCYITAVTDRLPRGLPRRSVSLTLPNNTYFIKRVSGRLAFCTYAHHYVPDTVICRDRQSGQATTGLAGSTLWRLLQRQAPHHNTLQRHRIDPPHREGPHTACKTCPRRFPLSVFPPSLTLIIKWSSTATVSS